MTAEKLETEIARALRNNQDELALQLIQLRERLSDARPSERPRAPHHATVQRAGAR